MIGFLALPGDETIPRVYHSNHTPEGLFGRCRERPDFEGSEGMLTSQGSTLPL